MKYKANIPPAGMGPWLRLYRKAKGWSQEELGAVVGGIQQIHISSVERNEGVPTRDILDKLVEWVRTEALPDVINLPNSLLISLAEPLKLETPTKLTLVFEFNSPYAKHQFGRRQPPLRPRLRRLRQRHRPPAARCARRRRARSADGGGPGFQAACTRGARCRTGV